MPLPDANITIAAALYGACIGFLNALPSPLPQDAQEEGADAPETAAPEPVAEVAQPIPSLGASWGEAQPKHQQEMLAAASFLHSYAHGNNVISLDRLRATQALIGHMEGTDIGKLQIPYAMMVEIFVSTKQALS
jgi:hypothetical protein